MKSPIFVDFMRILWPLRSIIEIADFLLSMRCHYVLRSEFLSANIPFRQAGLPFPEKTADAGKIMGTGFFKPYLYADQ